jgi:hypothetical protein
METHSDVFMQAGSVMVVAKSTLTTSARHLSYELGQLHCCEPENRLDAVSQVSEGIPAFSPEGRSLSWIIHEVSSQKSKDALKGMMNTGFARPAFPFGASIA